MRVTETSFATNRLTFDDNSMDSNRVREAGETVSQYGAVLRHLVTDHKFNDVM